MPSKTPTKAAKSKKRTTKLEPSLKARLKATKKKRASTSSKRPSAQVKPGFEDVSSRVLTPSYPNLFLSEIRADIERRVYSEKAEKSVSTSAPISSRRGLYDGIITESTDISATSANSAPMTSGNSRLQEPESVEQDLQTSVRSLDGVLSAPQSDTFNRNTRRSFALFWISGGAVAFIAVLLMLLSKAAI